VIFDLPADSLRVLPTLGCVVHRRICVGSACRQRSGRPVAGPAFPGAVFARWPVRARAAGSGWPRSRLAALAARGGARHVPGSRSSPRVREGRPCARRPRAIPGRGRTPLRDRPEGRTPGSWPGPVRRGSSGGCGPNRQAVAGSGCSARPRDYFSSTWSDTAGQGERAQSRRYDRQLGRQGGNSTGSRTGGSARSKVVYRTARSRGGQGIALSPGISPRVVGGPRALLRSATAHMGWSAALLLPGGLPGSSRAGSTASIRARRTGSRAVRTCLRFMGHPGGPSVSWRWWKRKCWVG
jgi:hypothetical protein